MSNWIYWKCCYFLKHKSWPSDVPLSNKEMSLRVDLTQDPIHLVIFRVDGNQDIRELDNQVAHSRSCVTDNRSASVRVCAKLCQCRQNFNQIITPAIASKLLELSYFDIWMIHKHSKTPSMNRTFDYLFPLVGSDLIDPTPDLFRPATGRTTPPSGAYINYRTPGGNIDETD